MLRHGPHNSELTHVSCQRSCWIVEVGPQLFGHSYREGSSVRATHSFWKRSWNLRRSRTTCAVWLSLGVRSTRTVSAVQVRRSRLEVTGLCCAAGRDGAHGLERLRGAAHVTSTGLTQAFLAVVPILSGMSTWSRPRVIIGTHPSSTGHQAGGIQMP